MKSLFSAAVWLVAWPALVAGQVTSSALSGTVNDAAGAVIPNARVSLTGEANGFVRTVNTTHEGFFSFPDLTPATFTLSIEAKGFKTYKQTGILLNADEQRSVGQIRMEVGQVSESVTVTAEAVSVDLASGERAGTLTGQQLDQIALRGRDILDAVSLTPGVVDTSDGRDAPGTGNLGNIYIMGGRTDQKNMTIDGVTNLDTGSNGGQHITPSMDTVAEVKVLMAAYSAENGRNPFAINVISKGGAKDFHGSAGYYFRNEDLNANDFFSNEAGKPRAEYRYNIGSYTIGGPVILPKLGVVRHKLFFFFGQEFQRQIQSYGVEEKTVPTALETGAMALTALHGLGGIGKTQLARGYARQRHQRYKLGAWIEAETTISLLGSLSALAPLLGVPTEQDQQAMALRVLNELSLREPWLVIFDNALSAEALRPYVERLSGSGHVLITSRNEDWDGLATTVSVTRWSPEESARFLLERTRQTDRSAAQALAGDLDGLVLALEHAAAYLLAGDGMTLAEYRRVWREKLNWTVKGHTYPASVAAALGLSLDAIAKENPVAYDLLCLFAWLAPDRIPRKELLEAGASKLPDGLRKAFADHDEWSEVIGALGRYSLLTRERADGVVTGYYMHRVVQQVVRDRQAADAAGTQWLTGACDVVSAAFPLQPDEPQNWTASEALLPHARAIREHVRDQAQSASLSRLLNQAALYLGVRGLYGEARDFQELALELDLRQFGPDHPNVAVYRSNLAAILGHLGEPAEAWKQIELALESDLRQFGPDHPLVAVRRSNLAGILSNLGEHAEAREQIELALELDLRRFGPDHPNVALCRSNLANILHDLGEPAEARKQIELALESNLRQFGPDHPSVATSRSNLATILHDLGDHREARKQIELALESDVRQFGPDHPNVAVRRSNLATILRDLGDHAEARKQIELALESHLRQLGPDHPAVAIDRSNLANILGDLGEHAQARKQIELALESAVRQFGLGHPSVALRRMNLAGILGDLGEYAEARKQIELALESDLPRLGPDHPRVARDNAIRDSLQRKSELAAVTREVDLARKNMAQILPPAEVFRRSRIQVAHGVRQSTTISGDFYNIAPRKDGSIGFYLVDVTGHGLEATLDAMSFHRVLSSSEDWATASPRAELERADRLIRQQLGGQQSTTMCFLEADPERARARFASAGMPPAVLFTRSAPPKRLQASGPYVGLGYGLQTEPTEAVAQVEDGDVIVMVSDGVVEARDAQGRLFGLDGLERCVDLTSLPEVIRDNIFASAARWSNTDKPTDDQTVVVIRIESVGNSICEVSERLTAPQTLRIPLARTIDMADDAYPAVDRVVEFLAAAGHPEELAARVQNAIPEVLQNIWRHGSEFGQHIELEVSSGRERVTIRLTQPKPWLTWDTVYGDARRTELRTLQELRQRAPAGNDLEISMVDLGSKLVHLFCDEIRMSTDGRRQTFIFVSRDATMKI